MAHNDQRRNRRYHAGCWWSRGHTHPNGRMLLNSRQPGGRCTCVKLCARVRCTPGLVRETSSSTAKAQVGKSADTAETKRHKQHHGVDTVRKDSCRDHRSSSRSEAPDRDHDRSRSRGRRDRERDRERSHRHADDRRKSTVSVHTGGECSMAYTQLCVREVSAAFFFKKS